MIITKILSQKLTKCVIEYYSTLNQSPSPVLIDTTDIILVDALISLIISKSQKQIVLNIVKIHKNIYNILYLVNVTSIEKLNTIIEKELNILNLDLESTSPLDMYQYLYPNSNFDIKISSIKFISYHKYIIKLIKKNKKISDRKLFIYYIGITVLLQLFCVSPQNIIQNWK